MIKYIGKFDMHHRGVAQVVERLVRDQEAAGSSPVTPTISSVQKGFHFYEHSIFSIISCVDTLRTHYLVKG